MRRTMLAVALLVAIALIPSALCGGPPLPPGAPEEWPVEEWHPMSPEEARPEGMGEGIRLAGLGHPKDPVPLDEGQSFYLYYLWAFVPYMAYDMETGELVSPEYNLQDRTDSAQAHITVTMQKEDEEPEFLEPTSAFTGTGEWVIDWYHPNIIFPTVIMHEYYIEYPEGLEEGTYTIHIQYVPCNPNSAEPSPWIPTVLEVGDP